jgi:hypothetical protein
MKFLALEKELKPIPEEEKEEFLRAEALHVYRQGTHYVSYKLADIPSVFCFNPGAPPRFAEQ